MKAGLLIALMLAAAMPAQQGRGIGRLGERYSRREPAGLTTDQRIAYWEKRVKEADGETGTMPTWPARFAKNRETTDFSYVDRASSLIDRALTADPDNYEALRLRVEVAMNHHRFPQVIEYSEKLIERNPGDTGTIGLLGDALMEMGRYEDAEREYKRMLDLSGSLFTYNRYAYYLFVTGKKAEALAWMAQAVEAGSRLPEHEAWCLVEFGDMLFKTGQVELAESMYNRAITKLPTYHRANAALGRLQASRNKISTAMSYFQKAQASVP
ncbi:MAG: tetratricopeptide repeat protein, partial [Bryobacteraceae bacterium]